MFLSGKNNHVTDKDHLFLYITYSLISAGGALKSIGLYVHDFMCCTAISFHEWVGVQVLLKKYSRAYLYNINTVH